MFVRNELKLMIINRLKESPADDRTIADHIIQTKGWEADGELRLEIIKRVRHSLQRLKNTDRVVSDFGPDGVLWKPVSRIWFVYLFRIYIYNIDEWKDNLVTVTVYDIAQYILEKNGPMTSMKLQKLVYYSQAWATVWDDDVLFDEQVEAWDNGPVVRELWEANKGKFKISSVDGGNASAVNASQRETIDRVLNFYSDKNAQWLSDLTHMEDPWKKAFAEGRNTEIFPASMSEYYSTLAPAE